MEQGEEVLSTSQRQAFKRKAQHANIMTTPPKKAKMFTAPISQHTAVDDGISLSSQSDMEERGYDENSME